MSRVACTHRSCHLGAWDLLDIEVIPYTSQFEESGHDRTGTDKHEGSSELLGVVVHRYERPQAARIDERHFCKVHLESTRSYRLSHLLSSFSELRRYQQV